jgi:ATP-binding cassette subfamily B protein
MMLEQNLRRHPLLALLTAEQMAQWLANGSEAVFQTGETIFQQGTPGTWGYLILDGKIRVFRTTAADKDISLGSMKAGEFFGEYALVRPGLNTATCRAAAVTRLLRLPLAPLVQFVKSRPEVAANLKHWLRLQALTQYLRGQTFLGFLSGPSGLKHLPHLDSVTVPALCVIQAKGLSDLCWYFLEYGQVFLRDDRSLRGRELGPGEWFGEQALLEEGTVATAVALTEVKCWRLTRLAFLGQALQSKPDSCFQTTRLPTGPPPRFEWVGQQQEVDCGLACLAMIARSQGLPVRVEQLRERLQPGEQGVSLMELQRLSEAIGLPCTGVRIDLAQWDQLRLPALMHLQGGHFVVLFAMEATGVHVGDPATGLLKQTLASFRDRCSGKALVFPAVKHSQATS